LFYPNLDSNIVLDEHGRYKIASTTPEDEDLPTIVQENDYYF